MGATGTTGYFGLGLYSTLYNISIRATGGSTLFIEDSFALLEANNDFGLFGFGSEELVELTIEDLG